MDPRSDLYSLGCVLYEMLTGEPPHPGSTPQAVIARKLTTPPTPVTTLRPTVPPALDRAVSKALALVPPDRFASAAECREALVATGQEVTGRPARRGRRWWMPAAGVGLVIAALAAFLLLGRHSTAIFRAPT